MLLTSPQNTRIRQLTALIGKARQRKKTGLFTVEGARIVREVPDDLLEELYVSESFEAGNGDFLSGKRYFTLTDELFASVSDTRTPQGILAVVKMPSHTLADMLKEKPFLLLLEDIQDPGNLGTLIRTAEGAGADGVILSKGCVDLFSPKSVRSTMGSLFRLPILTAEDLNRTVEELKGRDIAVYAAHLSGKISYEKADYTKGCAIAVGNEGNGLTDGLTARCTQLVRIPMEGKLESLNASVAGAILMYKAHEQRAGGCL